MSATVKTRTRRTGVLPVVGFLAVSLAACAQVPGQNDIAKTRPAAEAAATRSDTTKQPGISPLLEPAPDIFEATGRALWDGKRTLQGIWVAHPLAKSARRVRIFNEETGAAVDGALFKRDATLNETSVLISSDAAQMLGMTPGEAAKLRIVAVTPRKKGQTEAISAAPKASEDAVAKPKAAEDTTVAAKPDPAPTPQPVPAAKPVQKPEAADPPKAETPKPAQPEPAVVAAADPKPATPAPQPKAPAVDEPTPKAAKPAETIVKAPAPAPAPKAEPSDEKVAIKGIKPDDRVFKFEPAPEKPKADKPEKAPEKKKKKRVVRLRQPYIQAGTFSIASNASNVVRKLKKRGIPAVGRPFTSGGQKWTRVVAGPFASKAARDRAQRTIRKMGMRDAIPVRR